MSASELAVDVVVVGGGIAGLSAGYELAARRRVLILEREDQQGYHSTGRSAALFMEFYGVALVHRLTRASRDFLQQPPTGFSAHPLLRSRGTLYVAGESGAAGLERHCDAMRAEGLAVNALGSAEARALVPILRPERCVAAAFDASAKDIDVNELHSGYARGFASRGGRLLTGAAVCSIGHDGEAWRVDLGTLRIRADIVVNAAGGWADELASAAGAVPLGHQPRRRTAIIVDAGGDPNRWPHVEDFEEPLYFKPEAGKLMVSPSDETPSPPCDAQPDEFDVAVAVDRLERLTTLSVRHVNHRWAGLRTFAPDEGPVVGSDGGPPGFFWLTGLGGFGIMTAPALGAACAGLVIDGRIPAYLEDQGIDASALSPARLRR